MSGDVLYFSESVDLANELATAAQGLARASGGRAVDLELDQDRQAVNAGFKTVLTSTEKVSGNPELTAEAVALFSRKASPSVILVGSTRMGRQVGARVAARLRLGALAEARDLSLEGGRLSADRTVYAGKFVARVASTIPCLATVPFGAYEAAHPTPASIDSAQVAVSGKVKRLERRPKPKASVDLRTATIIVAAGRGFKKKEDLVLVEELAEAMGGVVGSSRPLTSDLGWLGEEHHIGLTGFYVRPELYLAIGISGQLQHVAGIKDSRIIAAVNRDKQAPIFQVADYGIVGDLYLVVPALLGLLRKKG